MACEVERSTIEKLLQTWAWIAHHSDDPLIASHAFNSLVKELGCASKARRFVLEQRNLPINASNDALYRRSIND